ncbi:MAG: STN domain-containing protein, partial [Pirellulaceae bacterium]
SVVQQQQWTVRFEPAIATRLKTLVTLKVTEATLDELLEKTLDPLGLTYQLKDQQLTITEKRP